MSEKKTYSIRTKIISVLIFVVFFAGIAGAVAFRNKDPRISVMCIGGVFFFVGLFAAFAKKLTVRTAPVLILCLFGAALAGVPLYLILAEKYPDTVQKPTDDLIVTLIGVFFALVGVCIAVFPTLIELRNRRVCTESAIAKCVELKSHYTHDKHGTRKVYSPVWEFEFYGKTYRADENNYSSSHPEVGEEREIFFNPFDPEEMYRKGKGTIAAVIIIGSVFVASGIGICFLA